MKIVHISPGSGGTFYCENCLKDTALVLALRRLGHDCLVTPMYLPFFLDGSEIAEDSPVFFGGVNTYLQQHLPVFRKTPRWLDQMFDARWVLKLAASREGSTQAEGLGAMTFSVLQAEAGNQAKELERMIRWLREQEQPDVIHISMVLLAGLAKPLKEALGVPVVCSLHDEDVWIDKLDGDYAQQCWDQIRRCLSYCDALVTVSHYYRDLMSQRLSLSNPPQVVPVGIEHTGYELAEFANPPVMGYLSKLCPSLGLGIFVDAFILLKHRPGLEPLRLAAMGGLTGSDRDYVAGLRRKLAAFGFEQDAVFHEKLDREARIQMLKSLRVLSVPMPGGEAFGTFMVEAWAAGVPVVQPDAGGFRELVQQSGGGRIYDNTTPEGLAAALEPLLRDADLARSLGEAGRSVAQQEFSVDTMAERMVNIYESVV